MANGEAGKHCADAAGDLLNAHVHIRRAAIHLKAAGAAESNGEASRMADELDKARAEIEKVDGLVGEAWDKMKKESVG